MQFSAAFIPGRRRLSFSGGSACATICRHQATGVRVGALGGRGPSPINRGFVPEDRRDLRTRAAHDLVSSIEMAGVMRWPEPRGYFTPRDDPGRNLWFVRDHLAIAAAKGWREQWGEVAPFFIDLETPEPPSGWPRPGALHVNIRNEHLQYAITWYGLAGAVTIMFVLWLRNHCRSA